ncbi:MAG: S8 family serine peptidase [Bacteroidota bacterium]
MKNQAFRILLMLASLGLVLMLSSCEIICENFCSDSGESGLCALICPVPCGGGDKSCGCNPCACANPTEEQRCECLQAKSINLEYVVYFEDSTICDSIPTDSTELVELAYKVDIGATQLDTFCQDRVRFLATLVVDGATIQRPNCDCNEFLVRFDENLPIDPRESITSAKGRLRHTGGGAGENFAINIGPLDTIQPIPAIRTDTFQTFGSSLIVGVVDMGISFQHPCIIPYNLAAPPRSDPSVDSYNTYVCNDIDVYDFRGHGTHIAGILSLPIMSSQIQDPNIDDVSLAGMKILSIKMTQAREARSDLFSAVCGIKYAVDKGAKIMNLSWGFYKKLPDLLPQTIEDELGPLAHAIQYAKDRDVLIIAAAGNDSINTDACHHWPSGFSEIQGFENVISVAALNEDQTALAHFSNFGVHSVQIAAPGRNIQSTFPVTEEEEAPFNILSGTSMAAPFVARLAAHYFYNQDNIEISPSEPLSLQLKAQVLSHATVSYSTWLETNIDLVKAPISTPLGNLCND